MSALNEYEDLIMSCVLNDTSGISRYSVELPDD
jgi:hypothetical protein